MKTIIFGLSLLISSQLNSIAKAQPAGTSSSDTTLFTAADFYRVVFSHHPIVRQAALLNSEAQQEIMQARGAFDPKLFSTYDRKEFGQSLYYDQWQSGLTVPVLPAGIDVKLTYDRNIGEYLNPENRVPETGLAALGIRVPVGQGLIIDARRTALRQARLAVNLADAERLKLINKTLFDAAKTYWEWYMAYQQYRLIQNGYQVADTRFRAIQQRSLLGDAAAIDTTEALITAQDRLVQFQQAEVNLQNARLRLSVFLWNSADGGTPQPVDLLPNVAPQPVPNGRLDEATLQALLGKAADLHPELLKLTAKGQQLALDERFQRSLLQPQLVVNANLLSRTPAAGVGYDWASYYAFRADNHKIGVDLTFPLFLRKERGKLRQIQIKNQQVTLERQQTSRAISNDVQAAWNELKALERQIDIQQQTVNNQRILLSAEQQKFDIGESSLFLVNSRESKLIDLEIKLEELRTKQQKAVAALWYAAGTNALISQ
ncbi:TolC family protein [Spirosoma sp.]|uniref:TolC family protein n=1 Tax=Spirosoma sp. TaxID=1899569 RepID=UPI002631E5A0|nr:TolC family protein [Spirosoma sp.]MCX6218448.1 TolC family protein [Spirosoma sp.]